MNTSTTTTSPAITSLIPPYLTYCRQNKRLDPKTIKAYRIDLTQFAVAIPVTDINAITPDTIKSHIATLHQSYKPKTVKRKIASLKAFFSYLEENDIIPASPFLRIRTRFREPLQLPRTIPLSTIEKLLSTIYSYHRTAKTDYSRRSSLQAIAIIELLFATGIRISELCSIRTDDIDLTNTSLKINGKGKKERLLHIGNSACISALSNYRHEFEEEISASGLFFPISDQVARRMIRKYCSLADIEMHITPHMFRHTFATSLLEADVDIRYIQEFLGHSSISVTEIYTYVTLKKQREILSTAHPRTTMKING
ncbi:MAG: tyrosine-type recombinase/integrase [Clostridiales bacterium]|nr:tyrosine-type recombinase/integrase [Clostridiales bacterium]